MEAKGVQRAVLAVVLLAHAWFLGQAWMRNAESHNREQTDAAEFESLVHELEARISAVEAELRVLRDGAALRALRDGPLSRRAAISSDVVALDPLGEHIARLANLERGLVDTAWSYWWKWARAKHRFGAPLQPAPHELEDLAFAMEVSCLVALAVAQPQTKWHESARDTLVDRLRQNAGGTFPLWTLLSLRRLGPQVTGSTGFYTSHSDNRSYRGDVLVPEDVVPALLTVGAQHPGLRAQVHAALSGVAYPAVVDELLSALYDPRGFVRESAATHLSLLDPDARTLAALREAHSRERDARVARTMDRALRKLR